MSENKQPLLTIGDCNNMFFRWWLCCEVNHSYERMQSLAYCWAMIPSLKKLYPEHDDFCAGLQRHMAYFNTQGIWGSVIHGIVLSMEEENAVQKAMSYEEADAAINGIKTGFMGPLAGIGDTIDWGTLYYIFIGLGMTFTEKGQWFGAVLAALLFTFVPLAEGFVYCNLGYRLGRDAVGRLFEGGMVDKLLLATGIVGMMMMGALGSTYVHFTFAIDGLQSFMDSLAPNVMCLIVIFIMYFIITKVTQKIAYISLALVGVGLLLALLGIAK